MLIGFNLPLSGPTASPATLARLAAEGEAIGYDYAAISDHIVEPIDIHARYPYTESGEFPASSRGERHEQLTVIAYLAAKTSKLKFLTSVMVAPHRPAVLTAKMLATIDVYSGGRAAINVLTGWFKDEFRIFGEPWLDHDERYRRSEEFIQVLKGLWTQERLTFKGDFYRINEGWLKPRPISKPHPEIFQGGNSKAARRMAAR